ncbi:MAG: oxidoreductase [Desulfuromonas sp.]|uniref:FAD/NAD(P)-binding protein n=1 Tax=Desulfuromonas sp. TaxID=892 RepID=UPI000CAB371B|nr:FAD/NAD(P)-binding protein [Desulfuromonas sp.]PLX82532.1 MAG: oxidoreductase [Desulfuromonas sp.]
MKVDFLPVPARVEAIERAVPDNHLFYFRPETPMAVEPGQFVELSLPGVGAFPGSAAAYPSSTEFQACIRRAGRVTSALYRLEEGAPVGMRGPFGNGFDLEAFAGRDVLLVAGGLGMAPLRALLQALLDRKKDFGEIILLYGSRDPAALLFREELESLARRGQIRLRFSVDFVTDLPWSSEGFFCKVGLVTGLLEDLRFAPGRTTAAVCGPPALYSCVLEELASLGIDPGRIYATLERRMKCGVGQCCHCVVGGRFVCRDGPVFSLAELRSMEGAI